MAKAKPYDLPRLSSAIRAARQSLRYYREEFTSMVREYVGAHYAEEGARTTVPVNLISLYTSVVGRNLIAKNPRFMLSTFDKSMKPVVAAMEKWANKQVEQIRLANVLQRVVLDALFSIGIAKVALATPQDAAHKSWKLQAGKPFCESVSLDDFVFDVHARNFDEVGYIGHRYRVPLDTVKDDKMYEKVRKTLVPSNDEPYNVTGDERVGVIGRGYYSQMEEFEDFVDLWEIYLPRHRTVLTVTDDTMSGASMELLREQAWLGPDSGPYHILPLGVVPGNAMPKGPIQDLVDLHKLENNLYRKLTRQAERQKELLLVAGGAMEDGGRIQQASDGEIIRNDNPDRAKPVAMGGPNEMNLRFGVHIKDLFGYLAGNLDMMGGLSPQSKTLGQDKMLAENASHAIADMQARTLDFVEEVGRAMLWYFYHSPYDVMRTAHTVEGLPEIQVPVEIHPHQRPWEKWQDLQIAIDPYSLQHSTPQARLQTLNAVVQQILPMMPLLQQQGIAIDMSVYLSKVAKYADMPDLAEILTIQEPPSQDQQGGGSSGPEIPTKPPVTERNYTRRSLGGDTAGNRDATLNNFLSANGQQNRNGQPTSAGT